MPQFPFAFHAIPERLPVPLVAVLMALEELPAVLRQRHGVLAAAGHTNGLDQPLLAEVPQVARARIERTIVVIAEITTGDHSKRADGCERARLRTAQGVLTVAFTDDLPL